jgi:hypothetical protein
MGEAQWPQDTRFRLSSALHRSQQRLLPVGVEQNAHKGGRSLFNSLPG